MTKITFYIIKVGWGVFYSFNEMQYELQQVVLSVYNAEKCEEDVDDDFDDQRQVCAGGDKKVSKT